MVRDRRLNVRLPLRGVCSVEQLRRLVKRRNLNGLCQLLGSLDSFADYAVSLAESKLDGWDAPDAFAVLESITLAECEAFLCENLTRERLALSVIRPNA